MLLLAILLTGALVRLAAVLGADFPAGDGGLFATMIEDIRAASFGLPAFTSYNGGDIPFAYPPLGLYLGALVPVDPLADAAVATASAGDPVHRADLSRR